MMYPIEKYKYYVTKTKAGEHKVIAATTYAGRTVRGVAICSKDDEFSLEKGKQLAAMRCALKVANKRLNRATDKVDEAVMIYNKADAHLTKMTCYHRDAYEAKTEVEEALDKLMASM